jgi:hypothetical protein
MPSPYVPGFSETPNYISDYTGAESIAVFQALKENTSVKKIDLILYERHRTKRFALVAA